MGNCISFKKQPAHNRKICPEITTANFVTDINGGLSLSQAEEEQEGFETRAKTTFETEHITTNKTNTHRPFFYPSTKERLRRSAYIKLNSSSIETDAYIYLTNKLITFSSTADNPINLESLSGFYPYCLVQANHEQYLLLNSFKDYESNHGYFSILVNKLPIKHGKIIAGGEIEIANAEIRTWNLKSDGFSQGGLFDESHPDFNENRERLYLPQSRYQPISAAKGYARRFFSRTGSFMAQDQLNPSGVSHTEMC